MYFIILYYVILFYFLLSFIYNIYICRPPNKHRPSKPPIHFMSLAKRPIYACCQAKRVQRPQPGQRHHTNFVFRTTLPKSNVRLSEKMYDARNSLNWSESLLRSVTWCVACDLPKDVEKLCLLHAPLHKLEKTCGALHPWKVLHLTLTSPVLNQLCSKAILNTRQKTTILTNWLRQLLPPIESAQNGNHKHPSQQSGFVDSGALLIHLMKGALFVSSVWALTTFLRTSWNSRNLSRLWLPDSRDYACHFRTIPWISHRRPDETEKDRTKFWTFREGT